MRFTLALIAGCILGLSAGSAAPPNQGPPAPPEFAEQQAAPKPAPFPTTLVDQGERDPKLKGLFAPEGFKVEIVAEAPVVVNPVGMTFGPDGTLFVIEWRPDLGKETAPFFETIRYRDGSTRVVNTMKKFEVDVVKQLTWNPQTGTYDRAETILTEELPSTILFHDGWLYTASRGTVRRYKKSAPTTFTGGTPPPTTNTGAATQTSTRWDTREVIAQGFCGFHHHQVSGLSIGPDGWLYITTGDDDNIVEGSDGQRANVLRTGAVYRCLPDGSKMEVFSLGYRNPYRSIAHNDRYHWFHADNDQEDGSKFTGCRLVHVAEESDYGWRLKPGARCCVTDFLRGAVAGERPGKLPPMLKTGRGAPAGVLLYHDTQLPPQYRGLMYYPDVFRKMIRAYRIAPKGSTFEINAEMMFMKSEDPLFRPCEMNIGPDGALYVCDWRTDSGGAGKIWGDGAHGRIYRLTWTGTKDAPAVATRPRDSWAKLLPPQGKTAKFADLVEAMRSPDLTIRDLAQRELARRTKTEKDLKAMKEAVREHYATAETIRELVLPLAEEDEPVSTRLAALYLLQQNWHPDVAKLFFAGLDDKEVDVRAACADGLGRYSKPDDLAANLALAKALSDEALPVRRAAALSLGRLGNEGAVDPLIAAWKNDNTGDPFLHDAYLRALERLGRPGIQGLLTLANSGEAADWNRVASAFLALRTKAAAEALPELLSSPHFSAGQRSDLIRSYLNYQFDPPLSLDPLASYLVARPKLPAEVKIAGLEVLAASNALGGPEPAKYVSALVFSDDEDLRMAAIAAIEQGRVALASEALRAALIEGKRPAAERLALMKAVRAIATQDCAATSSIILESKDEPAVLKAEALRCLSFHDPSKARAVAEPFLDQPDPLLIAEAVAALGTTEEGALIIGQRYLDKKLPRDLYPRVSEVLRKFPKNPEIARMNAEVMKGGLLLSTAPGEIDKIRALVQLKGDAKRGKAIYLNTSLVACASCHKLEGVGGQVGPDLTRVWETSTIEKLLESIVEPSKEIKEGFTTYKLATVNGQVFTGLKLSDTPADVVIREATGRDVRIDRRDIDELVPLKVSLMPDNVVSQLSFDQFIDLLAFLKSRKEQELMRGAVLEFSVFSGIKGDFQQPDAFELNPQPGAPIPNNPGRWQTAMAEPNGMLSLKTLIPSEPTGVYITAAVFSPTAQTANVVLYTDDPIRVSMGGKEVFFRGVPKLVSFNEAEKFKVDLAAGWNTVTVKMQTSGSLHRLGLQFQGEGLRTAAVPEKK
jgi:putative membrane-bound dehydrogenase-like protein